MFVDMPDGSVKIGLKIVENQDIYTLFAKKEHNRNIKYNDGSKFYKTIEDVIEGQCSIRWFPGHVKGRYSFAGAKTADGSYKCDKKAKSGTLFRVRSIKDNNGSNYTTIVDKNAGKWEIRTLENDTKILVVLPNRGYSDVDGYIYSTMDGIVYGGTYIKKGSIDIIDTYNDTATEAIKKKMEEDINSRGKSGTPKK
jgi:hypothetical protein